MRGQGAWAAGTLMAVMTSEIDRTSAARPTFGEMLRRERQRLGLAHRDLAARCSVSRQVVAGWEADAARPNRVQLKKLFGSVRQLRHYVHLLRDEALEAGAREDADEAADPLPSQVEPTPPPAEAPPATFREAIRRARLREGLDQQDVGDLLGVTQSTVSTWERGEATPVRSHVERLVELFPELATAPPPGARDIEKPSGPRGWKFPRDEEPSGPALVPLEVEETADVGEEEDYMAMKATGVSAAVTTREVPDKAAMIAWGRAVHAVLSAPNAAAVVSLLETAARAGMTVEDVVAALRDA